jgi:hypothetical protein
MDVCFCFIHHSKKKQTIVIQTRNKILTYDTKLMSLYKPFWEDDLPNLFGINPIEASLIFGFLYYLYGPEALYDYAREAGKFVSTYVPIVRDLSINVFNEFKDYIEEDRQRDDLKKRGVDISRIPRRTTNVIERVQESFAMLSEMTDTSKETERTVETPSALTSELFIDPDWEADPSETVKILLPVKL